MRVHNISLVAVLTIAAVCVAPLSGCVTELDIDEDSDFGIEPEDDGSNLEEMGVYNCTERDDNGYRSGSRFSIKVVTVDGKPVERDTANAYIAMQEAAARAGVNIRIVSGFRTNAEQQRLYNCYVNCNCNSCNLAARPGYSNHQSGHALDLNTSASGVLNWLNNNGRRYGFSRTVPSEPWHWEWWGNSSDFNGPCGGAARPSEAVAPSNCGALGASGGIVEEDGNCMTLGGPTQYLRSVSGTGHDGSLVWTGATANSTAANYGIWWVKVPQAGRYKLEVYVNRDYATSTQAKYSIRHNGRTDVVSLNYTTAGGFRSLGEFEFSGAAGERVRLDDNTGDPSSQSKRLIIDALRVTRITGDEPTPPPPTQSTPTCTQVRVNTDGAVLNVRPTASTAQAPRGTLRNGETVNRLSTARGQEVRGNTTWYEIQKGSLRGFISGAYATCVN